MSYKFSKRSLERLKGVDSRLVDLITKALSISKYDFGITEGVRDIKTQERYFKEGKAKTMKSKHLIGKAVDVVMYDENHKITWNKKYYEELNDVVQKLAREKGYKINCGGR